MVLKRMCVLAAGDDELDVGGDDDASSEVAGSAGRRGNCHADEFRKKACRCRTRESPARDSESWN
jgi:hypothetical protein